MADHSDTKKQGMHAMLQIDIAYPKLITVNIFRTLFRSPNATSSHIFGYFEWRLWIKVKLQFITDSQENCSKLMWICLSVALYLWGLCYLQAQWKPRPYIHYLSIRWLSLSNVDLTDMTFQSRQRQKCWQKVYVYHFRVISKVWSLPQ